MNQRFDRGEPLACDVGGHLEICPACAARLKILLELDIALRSGTAPAPCPGFAARLRARLPAVPAPEPRAAASRHLAIPAAALCAALGALWLFEPTLPIPPIAGNFHLDIHLPNPWILSEIIQSLGGKVLAFSSDMLPKLALPPVRTALFLAAAAASSLFLVTLTQRATISTRSTGGNPLNGRTP